MARKGREFEKLITRIEAALAPKGATVTSPDYITDKVTGARREVDATIRYQIGTVPIIIAIEGRDRKKLQDVTWIEQLAKKRDSLGIAKTIAVSSSPLSASAFTLAKHEGIEIRLIAEMSDDEIGDLVLVTTITNRVFRSVLVDVAMHLEGEDPLPPEMSRFSAKTQELIDKDKVGAPVFIRCADGKALSVDDFIRDMRRKCPQGFYDVPEDGSRVRRRFRTEFRVSRITIDMESGPVGVRGVDYALELSSETTVVPVEQFRSYSDDSRRLLIAGEATATIRGRTLIFTVLQQPDSNQCHIGISSEGFDLSSDAGLQLLEPERPAGLIDQI
jgi:hypothetical protein